MIKAEGFAQNSENTKWLYSSALNSKYWTQKKMKEKNEKKPRNIPMSRCVTLIIRSGNDSARTVCDTPLPKSMESRLTSFETFKTAFQHDKIFRVLLIAAVIDVSISFIFPTYRSHQLEHSKVQFNLRICSSNPQQRTEKRDEQKEAPQNFRKDATSYSS